MLTKVVTQDKHKLCADIVGLRIVGRRLEGEICCFQPPTDQPCATPFFDQPCEDSKKPKSSLPVIKPLSLTNDHLGWQHLLLPYDEHI